MNPVNRSGRRRFGVLVVGLCLLLAGCGSRRSHAELQSALVNQLPVVPAVASGAVPAAATANAAAPATTAPAPAAVVAPTNVGSTSATTTPVARAKTTHASGKSSLGGKTSPARVSGCTGTEKPIALGAVGQQTGVAGAVVVNGPRMVSAWAAATNAAGGLACHPVKYIIADDGGSPAKNASLVQQLVERDGVIAFVQMDDPLSYSGSEKYLVDHQIPVIGTDTSSDMVYNHPNFFPQASSGKYSVQGSVGAASTSFSPDAKAHFAALSCQEIAACTYMNDNAKQLADMFGLTLVYKGQVSITQPDYTATCVAAKDAGAKGIFVILDGNSVHRLARSCTAVQYKPEFITPGTGVVASMLTDPNLNGFFQSVFVQPFTNTANPMIAEMNATIAKYAPGLDNFGQSPVGWTSAKLLEYAVQFLPAKDSWTSADIMAAMGKVKNYDVGGMTAPLTFAPGKNPEPFLCWFSTSIRDGKWVAVTAKRTCK